MLVPLAAGLGLSQKTRARPEDGSRGSTTAFVRSFARRPIVAGVAFALFVALGVLVAPRVGAGFLPSMDEGAFVLDYFLPGGHVAHDDRGDARAASSASS